VTVLVGGVDGFEGRPLELPPPPQPVNAVSRTTIASSQIFLLVFTCKPPETFIPDLGSGPVVVHVPMEGDYMYLLL